MDTAALKLKYPDASDKILDAMASLMDRYDLSIDSGQISMKLCPDSSMKIYIRRDGYRKIATTYPNYIMHYTMPLYIGDSYVINGDTVTVSSNSQSRNYNNLCGAIGVLYRTNKPPCVVRVSYMDYLGLNEMWLEIGGKPDTMIQKVAETTLIRMAFMADLVDYVHNESDELGIIDYTPGKTREEKMKFISEHSNLIPMGKVGLKQMTVEQLDSAVKQINEKLKETETSGQQSIPNR